ncbi:MAG: succinate dehydrogenase [Alphaproteobacteria bacterium]|jgi:fumarate reductase subunit C|nr:succinate dehydrogenase [Alphaproteobacteria bacterium]
MEQRLDIWLWLLQRGTAVLLAVFVVIHFVTIVLTIGHGVSAGAIAARVADNGLFLLFYGLFAVSAALHGCIGLRNILRELTGAGRAADLVSLAACALLLWLGLRAAFGLYGLAA